MRKLKNEELGRLSVDAFRAAEKIPAVIVLDNIRSAYNTGSVFRTADAFRAESVILCGITPQPTHREVRKTALGATESVAWQYSGSAAAAVAGLKERGYIIAAVEQAENSTLLSGFRPLADRRYALVFGHEVKGVSEEVMRMADLCLEIPQCGTKHSLNIAVSAGIVLWHFRQQTEKPRQ